MAESLFRRNPKEGDIINILKARRSLYNKDRVQVQDGKSVSMRNPAWITLTGHDMSCGGGGSLTLPRKQESIEDVYNYGGGSIKPFPDLESVVIEYTGEHGLARKITGRIRCYKISDFEMVQKYFLLPGNEIDTSFGYPDKNWGYGKGTTLEGFKVATFSFNTTQDGHWICEFTAVSSAQAIKNLDMQTVICNGCNAAGGNGQSGNSGPLKYLVYDFGGSPTQHPVKGIAQLVTADAQKNGTTSLDDLQDGEVITSFVDYNPGSQDKSAAIVVYTGDHIRNTVQKFMAWAGGIIAKVSGTKNEVEAANNQVYLSLGYVVNRLINDQLLKSLTCSVAHERDKFNKLKVEFHPEYSKSKVASGITSGDPLTVLLLGDANYKNNNGNGKNFDADCKNLGAAKSNSSGDIRLQNILVHRDLVVSALNDATKPEQAEADKVDTVKDKQEEVVNIIDFFRQLSGHISAATGGAMELQLVENPDDFKSLIVVDQNFGVTDTLNCVVFDPIDGDGSTRTCEVQSNVGSQEYKAAMFVGSSKGGDAVSALRDCNDKLKDQRQKEYDKAKTDKDAIIKSPGNLGENQFDGTEINALKSVMSRLHKNNPNTATNELVHYPGLSISIDIDGTWGFIPGNAISSTQVPKKWRNTLKSYFMVRSCTHTFSNSDWNTNIQGILGYYPNINYIEL